MSLAARDRRRGRHRIVSAPTPPAGLPPKRRSPRHKPPASSACSRNIERRGRGAGSTPTVIEGDPALQQAIRLSLFHLMGSVASDGEAAVGARGLSGSAYSGHVFWDSDIFVLPFLAATHPASARAMLEYRVRRLPAARASAQRIGRAGAQFRLGVSRGRLRRDAAGGAAPDRCARPHPHRRAGGAHRRGRRLGGVLLPGLGLRRRLRGGRRPRASRRDRALLGIARPSRRRWTRSSTERDRAGRVPRAGGRQRLHQRNGALEPAAGRDARRHRPEGARGVAGDRRRWSTTATTTRAVCTSSSRASSTSSRS